MGLGWSVTGASRQSETSSAAGQPIGHRFPTPAVNAHTLDQDQRRAATRDVIGQGHRAVAGKAGRAYTDRAREVQPDSHTLPQLAAKLAECHLSAPELSGPGPTREPDGYLV
jgi:hypothetical protein